MPVNTKNHASKRPPVLRSAVKRRLSSHSGSPTQPLTAKETETAEILRSMAIGKNYRNRHILEPELQAAVKASRAAAVAAGPLPPEEEDE
jgi:hypothetical protein